MILQPWRGLHLFAGPGFESAGEDGTRFLFRVGVGWELEMVLIDGEEGVERAAVFGASFGLVF